MKLFIKNIQLILLVLSLAVTFSSCNEEADIPIYQYPTASVTDMVPASGYPGTYVEVSGANFGDWQKAIKVSFGGIQSDEISIVSDNLFRVKVPEAAVSGKVTVQVWTTVIDSVGTYTVVPPPVLNSVISEGSNGPVVAAEGDIVVLRGTGFGTDASKLEVSFNGVEATIVPPVNDTSVRAIAPDGYTSGLVYFTKDGLTLTGSAIFNPAVTGDISDVLQNHKQPFASTPGSGTGRWRIPAGWIVTDPIKNHGGNGGWGSDNGTVLAIESGWGSADVVGGAMYQTLTMPAGSYTLSIELGPNGVDENSVYLVAAEGTSIPTTEPTTSNTLGFSELHTGSFDFTLTETTQVSLGFDVVSMTGNKYWRVTSLSLVLK
jgi:hypothetical protein